MTPLDINEEGYRHGFNGKEKTDEVSGPGNIYDYGFRIYNARIGKFLSVDPLAPDYPWYTPYQFAGNKPVWKIDLDGLEEAPSGANNEKDKSTTGGDQTRTSSGNSEQSVEAMQRTFQEFMKRQKNQASETKGSVDIPKGGISTPPNTKQDETEVITAASITATGVGMVTDAAVKEGYWIGQTSKGKHVLYGPEFSKNQYVKKTPKVVKLNKAIKFTGGAITAISLTSTAYDAYMAKSPQEQAAYQKQFVKEAVIAGITYYQPAIGIMISVGDHIYNSKEMKQTLRSDYYQRSQDYTDKNNYMYFKMYQEKNAGHDPCPCYIKQGK